MSDEIMFSKFEEHFGRIMEGVSLVVYYITILLSILVLVPLGAALISKSFTDAFWYLLLNIVLFWFVGSLKKELTETPMCSLMDQQFIDDASEESILLLSNEEVSLDNVTSIIIERENEKEIYVNVDGKWVLLEK